jgi:hypothetical protein
MTVQVVFWLILGGWAVAAVWGLLQLAFDALKADARGARLPARSLLSALRNPARLGVMLTCVAVFSAIFQAINETWDLSFELFSYDLATYNQSVKRAVVVAGVWICSMIVFKLVDRVLDKLLPNEPANPTPTAENSNDRRVANGNHAQPTG